MYFYYIAIIVSAAVAVSIWLFFSYKPKKLKKTDSLYTEALNAMLLADKNRAIILLRDVVKQDSNHVNAYLQLGNLLRDESPERSIKIHQMLTVRPNLNKSIKIEIYKSLAMDYEIINRLNNAKKEAEQILLIDKQNNWALLFLLNIGEKTEDWDYAEDKARRLQKKSGDSDLSILAKYIVNKSIDRIKNNAFEEAELLLKKAIEQAPQYALPYKYLGDIKLECRDLVKAVEYWEKFMDFSPEESNLVFDSIESALFDLGRYSEVENFYRRFLEKNPVDLHAGLRLANVLNEKGENQAAVSLIDQLIENGNSTISIMLMKLKLSLLIETPSELGAQIDAILELLSSDNK